MTLNILLAAHFPTCATTQSICCVTFYSTSKTTFYHPDNISLLAFTSEFYSPKTNPIASSSIHFMNADRLILPAAHD